VTLLGVGRACVSRAIQRGSISDALPKLSALFSPTRVAIGVAIFLTPPFLLTDGTEASLVVATLAAD
jgi:hypothetical protein